MPRGVYERKPKADAAATEDVPLPVQVCAECFPEGPPAGAYSVGCAHGTWVVGG